MTHLQLDYMKMRLRERTSLADHGLVFRRFLAGIFMIFGLCSLMQDANAQGMTSVNVTGIPPVIDQPFTDRFEQNFRSGRYQVIFTYNNTNTSPVAFRFRFRLSRGGKELLEVTSEPRQFQPGAYVFTSLFQDLPFRQTFKEVLSDVDSELQKQLLQEGTIPEGNYTLNIQPVPEEDAGMISSPPSVTPFSVRYPQPPTLINPPDESNLTLETPVFNWTPIVGAQGSIIQYDFLLVEVFDTQTPLQALNSNRAHAQRTLIGQNNLVYTPEFLPLEEGHQYAWMVTANSQDDTLPIKNEGESEIRTFVYKARSMLSNADFDRIPLQQNFAALTNLTQLEIRDRPNSIQLNGPAEMEVSFDDEATPRTINVDVRNLVIQKGSMQAPVISSGTVTARGNFFDQLLGDASEHVNISEVRWTSALGLTGRAEIVTPDGSAFNTTGDLYLSPAGIRGRVTTQGQPLAVLGEPPLELTLNEIKARFPGGDVRGKGEVRTLEDMPCEVPYMSLQDGFRVGIDCEIQKSMELVEGSDRLTLGIDDAMGQISGSWSDNELNYDIGLDAYLGLKLENEQYCENDANISLTSEDGLSIENLVPGCVTPDPTLDLGFLHLTFHNLAVETFDYDQSGSNWNFDISFDAEMFFPTAPNAKIPPIEDVHLTNAGIQFPSAEFQEPDLQTMGEVAIDKARMRLTQFLMDRFTFPWFDWQTGPGPWDFTFEATTSIPDDPLYPRCLRNTDLQITGGHVEDRGNSDRVIIGDINVDDFGSCSWQFGTNHTLNIDDLAGQLSVEYTDGTFTGATAVAVQGDLALGEPFNCGSDDAFELARTELRISGGLNGRIENITPDCPLQVGPYTAEITSSTLDFSHSISTGQRAVMNANAELQISEGQSATGQVSVNLIDGSIEDANFEIQGPFEWGIPKENPVLTFRIDQAQLTEEGFFVDGRQELLVDDETTGATFDQLVLDWDTFRVQSGSIILDETISFQAGIDPSTRQIDYQTALGDTTLDVSPGVLMQLAGTVEIDTLGLHTSGTAQTKLNFGGLALDSLDITYSDDFAIGLKPFGIQRGEAEIFWNDQRIASADNSGFHPDAGFFSNQFLPDRLPLPTEQIAYIQLKENDQLVVNTTQLQNGEVRIETRPNTPLTLVLPALQGNLPQAPELDVTLNNVRVNPSTGSYIGGTITATVPDNDSRFDLERLNIPLIIKQIEYAVRNVNNNPVERLFLDGNLKILDHDLGNDGNVSLFIESGGTVKGTFDLPNLNESIPLDPNSDRVVARVDSLGGTVVGIPLFSGGQPDFVFRTKGGFQINDQNGNPAAVADLRMRIDDQGLAVTDFNSDALQDTASLDMGVFGIDIANINTLSLNYSEQDGFDYYAGLDFILRLNLPNQESMSFPLKNVEIRDDLGFVIPQQDIHSGSNPSLNAPAFDMGIFHLRPLAFRMSKDTVNWQTWSPGDLLDLNPQVDLELTFPDYQNTAPELAQASITLQNLGFSNGILTGSLLPLDFSNDPIYLPIGANAGISIDGISGGLLDPGDGSQGFDIQLSGYIDMPSFFTTQSQVCNQTRVDVNLTQQGGLRGSVQNFLPCGDLELGPLSMAFGQSALDFSYSNGTQAATLAGSATANIQRENSSAITANGNLTFDLLNGKVLNGDIGINQNFDWYFPSDDSLFAFEVQSARIDTAGIVFTGNGSMQAGNGSVSVAFNDLAFSLADGSISYGSVQMMNEFALDIGFNPTQWSIEDPNQPMAADPGVRLTMPPNLVLDRDGLEIDGQSGASLSYGEESYSNLDLDFVNMIIGTDPVGVTSGRADFMLDDDSGNPVRLAWYDAQGFHPDNIAGGVPLPDTLGLPSKDVAYIVLKDQNGNNLVQSSAVNDGLSLSTSQPLTLVLTSLQDPNGDHPEVDVSFSDVVINGAYEVITGSITADLTNTPLNLDNYGDYPFGLTAIHFIKHQDNPYKTYVDAKMDLPDGLTDLVLTLEKIAMGENGFEETTLSFGSYTTVHTEGSEPALASHSFSNNALRMAMRGAEVEFGSTDSYRLSGDISSNFIKNANGDSAIVHFAAEYSNSDWQFSLDTDHLTPQEVPIGQGKLILDDVSADVSGQEFALILDGRFALSGVAGDDLEIGLEDLRVGTDGVSVANVNSSGLVPQTLSLFGETDNLTITALDLQLTSQNDLMLDMDGSLSFLDRTFDFANLQLGSDGTFAMGSGDVNLVDPQNPEQLMDEYLELTELSIGVQNSNAVLTAEANVTLPEPFNSTSSATLTVDHTGSVTSSGPQFTLNNTTVDLGDVATLQLTGVGLEINDISTPDITFYASAELEVDGKTIEFGQPGNASDWGVRYQMATSKGLEWNSPSNHPTFTFTAGFFDLTIKQAELADDTGENFGVSLNTGAEMQLDGIGGELDLDNFVISTNGIESMGEVTGGGLNIANVVDIELGGFDWQQNATIDIEQQDGTNENPGSTIKQVDVDEYLEFSESSGGGGNAVAITIPGGFSGSVDKILYYRNDTDYYLNIDGVDIALSDYGQLYASLEYEKTSGGFELKVAGGGNIKTGGQQYGLAAMGRMSNINNNFSFGIFVSVQAEVPIIPGVVTLTEAGGGFFYKASTQDFEDVLALSDYELYNDQAPWDDQSESYEFAIALNAGAGIVGMEGGYAVDGEMIILITDEWFAMDVRGQILNQGNSLEGGMYLTARWSPRFKLEGGVGLIVDYDGVIEGDVDLDFFVMKDNQDNTLWAINGDGDLDIIGGINAETNFVVSPDGFYLEVDVSQGFDVWVISINSNFNGSLWWIYNEEFGAYVEVGFNAELFAGAASIGGTLKGALIVDNGYLIYATASAHVSVFMIFDGRVSVWVSLRNGNFDGGRGSNGAYESMIADAQEEAQNMEDKMNEALDAAEDLENAPDILKVSDDELAAAGAQILNASYDYRVNLYSSMISDERQLSGSPVPSIYTDIQQAILNNPERPEEADFNLETLRTSMGQQIDQLKQMAAGTQTRLRETQAAAIQWEAQAEAMLDNVLSSPVSSSQLDWQGDQPPSFDIDETQAADNRGSLEQLKQDIDQLDQKYRAALDSIRTNIDRIDQALSVQLPVLSIQQGLQGQQITQQGEFKPSANMVSKAYVNATKSIDKFYGNYVSFLWSNYYWARNNRNVFNNVRTGSVEDAVISASESQLQDLGINVTFNSESDVNVGSFNSTTTIRNKVRRAARERYFHVFRANPDYSFSQATSMKNNFSNQMTGYWNNQDYGSFFGNFVQRGIELWHNTPTLGYETIRNTAQTSAEDLATTYKTNVQQMQHAHETFTALVDDIYEIKASMSTTLHGLLEVYIAWKTDPNSSSADSSITTLEQQKQDLQQRLAAPQISNISYTKKLTDFSNKVELSWNVNHPSGRIVENSYYLGEGTSSSIYAQAMISTGSSEEVTRYLLKEDVNQLDKNYRVVVRARGPAGIAISRPANFQVAVDQERSSNASNESGPQGVTQDISETDDTPPSRPYVSLDLESSTTFQWRQNSSFGNFPVRVPIESYWTRNSEELTFTTISADPQSDIAGFEYAIGSSRGGSDIRDWTTGQGQSVTAQNNILSNMSGVDNFAQEITIYNLDLETGRDYYLSVRSVNGDSLYSSPKQLDNSIRFDDSNPSTPIASGQGISTPDIDRSGGRLQSPVNSAPDMMDIPNATKHTPRFTVEWGSSSDQGSGISEYEYVASTSSDATTAFENSEINSTEQTQISINGSPLTFNDEFYVHIRARDYSGRVSDDILTYGPVKPNDPTPPRVSAMAASVQSDGPGFYLIRPSLDLETEVDKYQFAAGTSRFSPNIVDWTDLDMSSSVSLMLGLWNYYAQNDLDWPDQQARFINVASDDFTDGQQFHLFLRTLNGQGTESSDASSGPIVYDSSPPENPSISLQHISYSSQISISASNINDSHSGITKVEYKVIDTSKFIQSEKVVQGWTDFMPVSGTQMNSLSGSKNVNISGHLYSDLKVKIRVTNGAGLQNTTSKVPANIITQGNYYNYNFSF